MDRDYFTSFVIIKEILTSALTEAPDAVPVENHWSKQKTDCSEKAIFELFYTNEVSTGVVLTLGLLL